jgi:hypothetical protein
MKRFKVLSIVLVLALLLILIIPIAFFFAPTGIQSGIARSFAPQSEDLSADFQSLRMRPGYLEVIGLKARSGQQKLEWETLRVDASLFSLVRAIISGRPMIVDRIALSQFDLYIDIDALPESPEEPADPFTFDFQRHIIDFDIRIGEFSAHGNIYVNDGPEISWQTHFIDLNTSGGGAGNIQFELAKESRWLSMNLPIAYQFADHRLATIVGSPDLTLREADGTRVEISGMQFAIDTHPLQATLSFSQRQPQTKVSIALPTLDNLPDDFPQQLLVDGIISTRLSGQSATTGPFNIAVASDQGHRFNLQSVQSLNLQFSDDGAFQFQWPEGDWLSLTWESFLVPLPDWPTRVQGAIDVSHQDNQLRIHTRQPLSIQPLFSLEGLVFSEMQLNFNLLTNQQFNPQRFHSNLKTKIKNPYGDDDFDFKLETYLTPHSNGGLPFELILTELSHRYPLLQVNGLFNDESQQITATVLIDFKTDDWSQIPDIQDLPAKNIFHKSEIKIGLIPEWTATVKSQTDLQWILEGQQWPITMVSEFKTSEAETHYQVQQASVNLYHDNTRISRAEMDARIDIHQIANSRANGKIQLDNTAFLMLSEFLPGLPGQYQNLALNFDLENNQGNLSLHLIPQNQPNPAPSASFAMDFHYDPNEIVAGSEVFRADGRIRLRNHDTDLRISYLAGSRSDALQIGIGQLILDPIIEIQERLLQAPVAEPPLIDRPEPVPTIITSRELPTTPFWKEFIRDAVSALKITITLEEARINNQNAIRNLNAELTLFQDHLILEPFYFEFVDAPSRIQGALNFQPQREQRYDLNISLQCTDLDSRKLARLAGPGSDHYLDTRIQFNGTINSRGNSSEELFTNAKSNYNFRTGPGVIRLIDPDQPDPGRELAVAAGRILLDMIAPRYNVIPALYEHMKATPFDRFAIDASSQQPGFLNITKFEMLSPELRLNGSGHLLINFSGPITQSPLNLQLSLRAKERMAELLQSAGALRGPPDQDGYRQTIRDFTIGGTIGRPDTSDLWRVIINRR